ncbi:NAD-dependent epimerase/dehydratase family protein [Candidatus Gottesmanbacteria bacterium]|nr:NAD-dependent epimerase/dehydratase family protein [Candidatus Gottesmanbacteria bacterium]
MKGFYKNKNILVTGGLGFIGSNLAIKLVDLGAHVEIVDALIPQYGGNLFNIEAVKDKLKVVKGDIRDKKIVDALVKSKEIIFNLAGTLSHIDSMADPMTDLEINCRAQLSLLESVRKYNPAVKIVFAGTRNQYGKAKYLPVDENHPQEPTDINGINNIAAEKYHLMYTHVYGIKTVSLRMTNTFGPRHQMKHPRQGVLNWFIRKIFDNEEVVLFGDGKQIRDVNYIDDVISALLIVGQSKYGWGEAYNLGGTPVSLLDFVKTTIKIVGRGSYKLEPFPSDRKQIEVGDYIASWDKMKKTYGWKPITSVENGIKITLDYYQKCRKHYW